MPPVSRAPPTKLDILHAYRLLYRLALEATQFATPARYQIRNILRQSFRTPSSFSPLLSSSSSSSSKNAASSNPSSTSSPTESQVYFNPRRIANTATFLRRAAEYNGIEHRILRNILHVRYWREHMRRKTILPRPLNENTDVGADLRRNGTFAQFDATLFMFNESQGLCLRA